MLKCGKFIRFIAVVGVAAVAGAVLYKKFFEEKPENTDTKKAPESGTKESFKKSLREYVPITFDGISKSKQKEDLDIIFSGEEHLKTKVSNDSKPTSEPASEPLEETMEEEVNTVTDTFTDAVVEQEAEEDISNNLT